MSLREAVTYFLSLFVVWISVSVSADPLTPLGPPGSDAAMMKTLNEIEPRSVIASLPISITNPGSYYVSANLSVTQNVHGIMIYTNDVHIDLNGFALKGTQTGASAGIYVVGTHKGITIDNGVIRNWGWEGIYAPTASDCRVTRVHVISNTWSGIQISSGVLIKDCVAARNVLNGFKVGDGSTLQRCNALNNQEDGFNTGDNARIHNCTATDNGMDGIETGAGSRVTECTLGGNSAFGVTVGESCVVQQCTAKGNGTNGVAAAKSVRVIACIARSNDGNGVSADDGSIVRDCICSDNAVDGIQVTSSCRVENNNSTANGRVATLGAGIRSTRDGNRIDNNNLVGNDRGILTTAGGSILLRNTARDNGTLSSHNYDLASETLYGRIPLEINGEFYTDNPWANFSF